MTQDEAKITLGADVYNAVRTASGLRWAEIEKLQQEIADLNLRCNSLESQLRLEKARNERITGCDHDFVCRVADIGDVWCQRCGYRVVKQPVEKHELGNLSTY